MCSSLYFLLISLTFIWGLSESDLSFAKSELSESELGFESRLVEKVSRPPCSPSRDSPDVILTGRVESLVQFDPSQGLRVNEEGRNGVEDFWPTAHALHVRVKRVIRGERGLEGTVVVIGGWPCHPLLNLRLWDSRIFILEKEEGGHLVLAGIPLQLTIENLREVTRRRNVADEPCAEKDCPFGGFCAVENEIGICKCVDSCPSVYTPVCGSDEVTFVNECHLKQFACQHQTPIRIKHEGECNHVNPCREKVCLYGSKCLISSNGSAYCQCPICHEKQAQPTPVCGSDGKVYGSKCELERSGCENGKNLMVKYTGKCDPCEDILCPHPSVCQLDGQRNPNCECGDICSSFDFKPVCGSDGITYNSECEMKQESCRTKKDLRIIYRGKCSSGVNPCDSVTCRGFEFCVINRFGIPQCTCPSLCPPLIQLVCGSDGLTYDSECELMAFACREEKDVKVAYFGSCELCEGVQCKFGARCEGGVCVCPTLCPTAHEPVCGSNSVTYPNECELQKSSCVLDHPVSLSFYGECFTSAEIPRRRSKGHTIGNCTVECYKVGSVTESCDPVTRACQCRPGVGGLSCDQCLPGYWGLHLISPQGNQGCQPCDCSEFGAIRDDCEQMSGNCECREGVVGVKCETCAGGEFLGPLGYTPTHTDRTESPHSYQWTGIDYTEPGDEAGSLDVRSSRMANSPGFKSTRHLQQLPAQRPTPVTFQMKSYLGDSCLTSAECLTPHSLCLNGWCACAEGFQEDAELIQCKQIHLHLRGRESCSNGVCAVGSTCFDYHNGSYACACPLGTSSPDGATCSKPVSPLPFFDGLSWIGLGQLGGHQKLSLQLQITPTFNFANGILIFSSQNEDGTGDFLSLALIDGHVEFRYELGDGVGVLKSGGRLEGGKTYEIVAKRYNQDGLLQVNGEEEIKGSSPGRIKSLNLNNRGFLGGVPINSSRVWDSVGTSASFVGCVHKLVVGRRSIEFDEGKESLLNSFQGVHQCFPKGQPSLTPFGRGQLEGPSLLAVSGMRSPCLSSPCQNNGECWTESVNGYRCICHPQFSGKRCELGPGRVRESDVALDLRGVSYVELPRVENGGRDVEIEIWFFPRSPDGVIIYTGQESGRGDYLTLLLSGGFMSFLFDLGSGTANITWSEPLSLHEWHWVVASRGGRQGRIQVDGGFPVLGKSPPTLSELNLGLPLYIGGVPEEDLLVRELGIPEPFNGVIQRLRLNGDSFQREIQNGLEEGSAERYRGAPCGPLSPCHNGGTCFPRLNNFHCLCPFHFTGQNCQIRKANPGPIRFNGKSFLQFPRKTVKRMKVQRRNEIEIVFKTNSAAPSVLIWIGRSGEVKKGRRGYLGLFLIDGALELRIDLGPRKPKKPITIRSKVKVNDGRWHQVLIVRRRRLIVFQVDDQSPQRATSPVGSNVLVSDGKIWIGGVGERVFPLEIPPSYHSGFRGCVDILKMEKRRFPLSKVAAVNGIPSCGDMDEE